MIRTSPAVDRLVGGHAEHAAEVVDVAVGVDHRGDGPFAERVVGELEAGRGRLRGGQRVDDDPAVVAGDEGDVGDVVAPGLPDAVGHLEQAVHAR